MQKLMALALVLFVLFCIKAGAQTNTVSGRVVTGSGQPVAGASVVVKGTNRGVTANDSGAFTIAVSLNDVLQVSSAGFVAAELPVNGAKTVVVTLYETSADLQQLVLVGSRRAGRVKTETAVPVDVIPVGVPQPTSRTDVTSLLNFTAPSFNYNKQSGSDGADHIDLATLRGLGPDQTLVLVNGKRRHQTAFVSVFGTRGRGNSGTDLNAIPISSIDRIEILRDGASAQYGSDAIAGVINIILKNSVRRLTGNVSTSAYLDNDFNPAYKNGLGQYEYGDKLDGKAASAGLDYGLPLGTKGGYLNLSADYFTLGKTYRQVLDTTDPVKNAKALPINSYRRANGDGSLDMAGAGFQLEVPTSQTVRFYSFGNYNHKSSDAFAFTRNFSARPERFPTDGSGNLIPVAGIIKTTSDGESYFNPHIQTKIADISWAAGIRGKSPRTGWNWDLSNIVGYNRFHFFGDKTFNASLGPNKTHFDDGGFQFLQNTANLNFSREYNTIAQGFNLAFGAEYRYERYTIFAGEADSYKNYNPDKATGSQGFPGFQPADEVKANRSNVAAYVDVELDVTKRWLLNGAVRVENYSDFGFTHNYKLATRIKAAKHFNLRGSVSTGFRAPSLQQINYSSTFTTVQGGVIAEVKIAPNYSSITKAAGIPELKQERSVNASVGFAFTPGTAFSLTVDGYWVAIKDRVVLSGQFDATNPNIDPALAAEMNRLRVGLAQFFANAVNTTNKGIDVVADYNKRWGSNRLRLLFAGNVQDMSIDKINVPSKLSATQDLRQTFLSDREQAFILASAPPQKLALSAEYGMKKWSVGSRLTYFGKVTILGYGQDGLGIDPKVPTDADPNRLVRDEYMYNGKLTTDVYLTYALTKGLTWHLGADNIFNVHPNLGVAAGAKGWAYNNEPAGPFDAVQMGGNGRKLFTRIAINF
ncbi:TonB-dependent receptor [Flavisolibacter nicotianae]|uniref:TonB-dependent receptor n=1 Tax=Flavisolibacter nicotianae TaxID=2364882 RepID=UPI000EB3183E|nr:TonB-dependent receptor [Flavisolibacter nicotianae]